MVAATLSAWTAQEGLSRTIPVAIFLQTLICQGHIRVLGSPMNTSCVVTSRLWGVLE